MIEEEYEKLMCMLNKVKERHEELARALKKAAKKAKGESS